MANLPPIGDAPAKFVGDGAMDWAGKVVVVTGGATGIGAATSKIFADHGASVVLLDLNDDAAETHVAQLKATGASALYVRGDVSAEKDVQSLTETTLSAFGRIDGLVNNAGIMRRHERFEDWTVEETRFVLEVNLLSLFITTYAIAPIMARTGGGAIVNISSFGGILPVPYSPCYAAAKAGVLGLTRSVAPMLATQGVRVNAVLPSFVDTPMTANAPARQTLPMLAPIDIARGVLHVASDLSLQGGFFTVAASDRGPVLSRMSDSPELTPVENSPF
jgi:NAD(P)-dependent dehydrogenase (short-subunit alcohol dehydrogenase family)